MSTAQTKGRPNTTINFISPEGLAFKTKQQVMKHISKVEKEKMRQKIDLNLNAEIRKKFWFAQSKRE